MTNEIDATYDHIVSFHGANGIKVTIDREDFYTTRHFSFPSGTYVEAVHWTNGRKKAIVTLNKGGTKSFSIFEFHERSIEDYPFAIKPMIPTWKILHSCFYPNSDWVLSQARRENGTIVYFCTNLNNWTKNPSKAFTQMVLCKAHPRMNRFTDLPPVISDELKGWIVEGIMDQEVTVKILVSVVEDGLELKILPPESELGSGDSPAFELLKKNNARRVYHHELYLYTTGQTDKLPTALIKEKADNPNQSGY